LYRLKKRFKQHRPNSILLSILKGYSWELIQGAIQFGFSAILLVGTTFGPIQSGETVPLMKMGFLIYQLTTIDIIGVSFQQIPEKTVLMVRVKSYTFRLHLASKLLHLKS